MQARPYQLKAIREVNIAWQLGSKNVLLVLPCGAGKTFTFSNIVNDEPGAVCCIAHRDTLVLQISMALAREGVVHRIIGSRQLIDLVIEEQLNCFGRIFYNSQSHVAVASVDTIIRRRKELANWLPTVKLWIVDEAHHLQKKNKWGTAIGMFPNARGLGVTATPTRTDGCGLGDHNDGVFHDIVIGPDMRYMIDNNYLTEYKIFVPQSHVDFSSLNKSKNTGEYNNDIVSKLVANSPLIKHSETKITGSIVKSYLSFAKGLRGMTFVPSMEVGHELVKQYNDAGVPAVLINASTKSNLRSEYIGKLKDKILLQIVNVDIMGEGVDVPCLEVVSFVRKTASLSLYIQQFGRVLRLFLNKNYGIVIDHVGNVAEHLLPDMPRFWSLEPGAKPSRNVNDDNKIALKTCPSCMQSYEAYRKNCPHCGYVPEVEERSSPDFVEGRLTELSKEVLEKMRSAIIHADRPIDEQVQEFREELHNKHLPPRFIAANAKTRVEKLQFQHDAQGVLRNTMAWYGGYARSENLTDDEIHSKFYLQFNIDWLSAQALPGKETEQLTERIKSVLSHQEKIKKQYEK